MSKALFAEAHAIVVAELTALRKRMGVSQVELARRLGKPQQFVSRVELGDRRVDIVEFYAVVRALNGNPTEVFEAVTRQLSQRVEI
jgi:transcriptional regulator with XRE-family HTH domain